MTKFFKNIQAFLLSSTLWIYLTLLLFMSFLLNVTIVKETWDNYIFYTAVLCVLYLPILLFAFFRKILINKLPSFGLVFIWILCFLIYPYLLFQNRDSFIEDLFPLNNYQHGNEDKQAFQYSFFLTVNAGILFAEIAILSNRHLLQWINRKQWLKQFDLEKMLLGVIFLVATIFAIVGTVEVVKDKEVITFWNIIKSIPVFVFYTIQIFLIFLGYFSFFYINKKYLIPKILKEKGFIYYGFAFVAVILIVYPLLVFLIRFFPIVNDLQLELFTSTSNPFAMDRGLIPILIMLLSVPIIVALQWFQQSGQIANLEKEKSATELNLLKQQINPHFFFNTLNNLYALSITKDKQTPEVIMQLSELMRYVIYRGKEEFVFLEEEIKYIEDYVQLQQIRLHKQLDFKFEKDIKNEKLSIPPLLFITFIENAFKHGIEPAEKDCFLHLSIKSDDNSLIFICKNSVEEKNTKKSGIGLENLSRRMELRFPNQHKLTFLEKEMTYQSRLEINGLE